MVPKDITTVVESSRALRVVRDSAVKARTATAESAEGPDHHAPEQLRAALRSKTPRVVTVEAARLRPDRSAADPGQATKTALRSIGARVVALNGGIAALETVARASRGRGAANHGVVRGVHPARRASSAGLPRIPRRDPVAVLK